MFVFLLQVVSARMSCGRGIFGRIDGNVFKRTVVEGSEYVIRRRSNTLQCPSPYLKQKATPLSLVNLLSLREKYKQSVNRIIVGFLARINIDRS